MTRIEEIAQRIGSRPSLVNMARAGDFYGMDTTGADDGYDVQDGVAIIDISGPLSNDRWSWGGTTYGDIQAAIKSASANPKVTAALFNVNSPGGSTDMAFETAAMISSFDKPCYSVANTAAYSAGYLLACQADKMYCVPTSGGVGSIGVYCAHFDLSEMYKQIGISVTLISAGAGKTNGNPYEPLSKDAMASTQADVDRLYGEFVGAVARGRKMDAAAIVKMGAKCFDGSAAAIAAGLADLPGDMETAWMDLCAHVEVTKKSKIFAATAARKGPIMAENEAVEVTQATAAALKTTAENASAETRAEAANIAAMCSLAGRADLTGGFITAKKTVTEVGAELMRIKAEEAKASDLDTGVTPGKQGKSGADASQSFDWRQVCKSVGIRLKEAI